MRHSADGRISAACVVIAMGFACTDEVAEPETTLDYEATSWTISGAINADALAAGGALTLVMREGGFVNGSLFEPAAITGGSSITSDMAGTWTKRGDTILFNQVSQSFVSSVAWILTPEMLMTSDSFNGSVYDVVLTRQFK